MALHFGQWSSFPFGGTLWRGQVCEVERRSELRSPLSPFPGTSLFCAVVWGSVLANACMLLYWWHQAEPIFFRRTEGGLRSRPVPGGCCIAGANLLLPVVLLLALISAPACCIAGADLLLPVAVLTALTCSRLLSHH